MAAQAVPNCTCSLMRLNGIRTNLGRISQSPSSPTTQYPTNRRTIWTSRIHLEMPTSYRVQQRYASSSPSTNLKTLPLHSFHLAHGAKLVPFASHSMPLVYSSQSHLESHYWTRSKASLFDVGHMLQHIFSGPGAISLLHRITPSYLPGLKPLESTLSVLLHQGTGGIVDDTMITRLPGKDEFRLVTNGATSGKVVAYLQRELSSSNFPGSKVRWSTTHSHDGGLLALQGPLSADVLTSLLPPLERQKLKGLFFGQSTLLSLKGVSGPPILISRGGYTGEDGFELATSSPEQSIELAEALWTAGGQGEKLRLAGLGARDSLRLEAGMCLYGHDLDDTTTPVEASLAWVVAKERRKEGGFLGAEVILPQLLKKSEGGKPPSRKRVGIIIDDAPAREGAKIFSPDNDAEQIGIITSGGPSPTLGRNIAMGYVRNPGFSKMGSEIRVQVRGKMRVGQVVKMPFVEAKYYREVPGGEVRKESVADAATTGAAPM